MQAQISPLTFAAEAITRVAGEACAVKAAESVGAVSENVARSVLALVFICKMKLQLQFSHKKLQCKICNAG
jgi:hypothetical protein